MKVKIISSIRTNNFSDDRVMQKITGTWKEASGSLESYRNTVYGVYHDYESDYKGDYSLSVAMEDNDGEHAVEIPNENYEIFKIRY
ncbi:hypothetical protein WMZ97_14170 [Lentibacillus sp. N15]|uniref:hypothetical protein n=1 Tax=Lentibacillus songyuanensis TaxID=3136161 RepID=UPI0031BB23DE